MKRIFTLLTVLACGLLTYAQNHVDETFQFVDEQGNVVPNGSVITVKTINEQGEMVVPLSVKNVSGKKAAVKLYETIADKPSGGWTTCVFGGCIELKSTGYSNACVASENYSESLQTEWKPVIGQYASWTAKLQIHVFNIKQETKFGQTIETVGDEIIGYGPQVTVSFEYTENSANGGSAVGLALMGSYTSDEYVTDLSKSSGLPNYPGNLKIASDIPAEELAAYQGGKIVKMRVAFAMAPGASTFFIAPYSKEGSIMGNVFEKTVDAPTAGWNEVEVETPYTIDMNKIGGLLLGFTYKQVNTNDGRNYNDECYPLSIVGEGNYSMLVTGIDASGAWYDFGKANLSVQAFVESSYNQYAAQPVDFGTMVIPFGSNNTKTITVRNIGTEGISSLSYVITASGRETEEETLTLSKAVTMFNAMTTVNVPMASAAEEGTEERVLTITKVNGQPNAASVKSAKGLVASTSRVATKRVVVEEYTGTGCGWCPRGMVGLENMHQKFGDKFIGIGIHQFNSSDAMYISPANYAPVSFSGAPSSQVNRSGEADPYYEAPNAVEYMLSVPAKVDVEVKGQWNDDMTAVNATATVNSLIDGASFDIEYVLVADGLKGTGTAWNQSNFYTQYTASQVPDDLKPFVSGGQYGKSTITGWTFNDVAIGSSYANYVNQATPLENLTAGQDETNTFTIAMPTKTTLKNAIDKSKVTLVAIVVDGDGTITNAAKCVIEAPSAIGAIMTNDTQEPVARYSLDGRQLNGRQKGLNIIRMADGRVVKTVVK